MDAVDVYRMAFGSAALLSLRGFDLALQLRSGTSLLTSGVQPTQGCVVMRIRPKRSRKTARKRLRVQRRQAKLQKGG
jgi:hypothetical protein